jgi:hypothetical protein
MAVCARDERASQRARRLQREEADLERRRQQAEEERVWQKRVGGKRTVHRALRLREETASRVIPLRSGSPDMTWGPVFATLLQGLLGSQPFWADLIIFDGSNTDEQVVVIESRNDLCSTLRGTTVGRLYIHVLFNHPCHGFSEDWHPTRVNDWSAACWTTRGCRITLRPLAEFTHFVSAQPRTAEEVAANWPRTQRFTRFSAWSHGVYKRLAPTEHLAVYHDDYSSSDTVVEVVAMAIREHYRRAAGGDPPAV